MPLERPALAVELAAAFARRLDPNALPDAFQDIARVADAAAALGVAGDDPAFLEVVARRVMADVTDARFTLLPPVAFPPVVFRSSVAVVRESDPLVLRVSWRGASVDGHVLRPDADAGARAALIVELPSQHLMEQAYSAVDGEVPAAPVPVRSAVSSRLAFSLTAGEAVPLTATGVLAAMRRLPPRVVVQARPRDNPWLPPWVIGELVDRLDPDQLVRLDVGEIADRHLAVRRALASLGGIAAVAAAPALGRLAQRAPDVVTVRGDRPQFGPFVPFEPGGIIDILAQIPAEPDDDMTALELPTRLVLSPSPLGGWAHADGPVVAPDATVELWHTRLGTRIVAADGTVTVDGDNGAQRIVRAVWTRDVRDGETWPDAPADGDWESVLMDRKPFLSSLLPTHRWQIVRNSLIREGNRPAPPVDADALSLTPLGAWTDLHGRWNPDTGDVKARDHRMAGGRDDFVRVVQRGYFAPCGFRAVWITETWREVTATNGMRGPAAPLRQRQYPVFQETVRRFTGGVTREKLSWQPRLVYREAVRL